MPESPASRPRPSATTRLPLWERSRSWWARARTRRRAPSHPHPVPSAPFPSPPFLVLPTGTPLCGSAFCGTPLCGSAPCAQCTPQSSGSATVSASAKRFSCCAHRASATKRLSSHSGHSAKRFSPGTLLSGSAEPSPRRALPPISRTSLSQWLNHCTTKEQGKEEERNAVAEKAFYGLECICPIDTPS